MTFSHGTRAPAGWPTRFWASGSKRATAWRCSPTTGVEWLEIYAAAAKAGLVAVPVNFRLMGPEVAYIVGNCEARALIVEDELAGVVEELRARAADRGCNCILFGGKRRRGYRGYELIASGADREPGVAVAPGDPWALMYTSGTTGKPKGAIRNHQGSALLSLVTEVELGFVARRPRACW